MNEGGKSRTVMAAILAALLSAAAPAMAQVPASEAPSSWTGGPSIPDLAQYMAFVQSRIEQVWSPPRGTTFNTIHLRFRVNHDGSVSELQITGSSGSGALDQSALAAVHRAAPYPAPPPGVAVPMDMQITLDAPTGPAPGFAPIGAPPSNQPAPIAYPTVPAARQPHGKRATSKSAETQPAMPDSMSPHDRGVYLAPGPPGISGAGIPAAARARDGPYLIELARRVQKAWTPPQNARSIRVAVHFRLYSDGSISDPRVAESSGNRGADLAALKALVNAAPMPAPPPGHPEPAEAELIFGAGAPQAHFLTPGF
jgi:TonB family protein